MVRYNLNAVTRCRYSDYIRDSAWFKADIRKKWGGDVEKVMQYMKHQFNGYQWHPRQAPGSLVYNPWAVLDFLSGSDDPYPWCRTSVESTLLNTVTLNAPAILETTTCNWGELTSPLSPRTIGSSAEWHKVSLECLFVGDSTQP